MRINYIVMGLMLGLGASLGVAAETEAAQGTQRPNIVFLLTDQWRGSATGYAGDPNVKTPNLDRLAKEGIQFHNAVSVCPVCTPYRASLMTGRFPTSTGMFLNDATLPLSEVCIADVFKQAGYATGYIGKWHLDGGGRGSYVSPERRHGWDYWKAAECDHSYNHSHYYEGTSTEKHFWQGYDAFAQTKDAQEYLRRQAGAGNPFVLMVSYGGPHNPYETAPAEFANLYQPSAIKVSPNVPENIRGGIQKQLQGYYGHCSALDKCVGDVMKTLAETGLAQNTILVFTADHGVMMGSHACSAIAKQLPWNEAANVPLLVRYPAGQKDPGRVVKTALTTPDLFATLFGLTGVALPKKAEGQDLSGLVRGEPDLEDRGALYMGVAPFAGGQFNREYRALRTSRYTYVRDLKGPWFLFDDVKDPYQMENLVNRPEQAQLQKQLDQSLELEMKRIHDVFRSGDENIKEWGYHVQNGRSLPENAIPGGKTPKRN